MIVVSHDLQVMTQLCDQLLTINQGTSIYYKTVHQAMLSNHSELFDNHQLVTVLNARVMGHDRTFGLTQVETSSAISITINGTIERSQVVRLVINAHDVAMSLSAPEDSSILNVLAGVVIDLKPNQAHDCLVTIQVGDEAMMSLVSKKSISKLGIKPATKVYLQIKTNAIRVSHF